jgi:hypothetical protein
MDPVTLAALIGGGSSILGGLINTNNQQQINQQNWQNQLFMAQNAIQMRVADANKAGINPLAALGSSFSPSAPQLVGTNPGSGITDAGQNISRALLARQDTNERQERLNEQLLQARIDNVKADTIRLTAGASRIATENSVGSPPPLSPSNAIQGNIPLPRSRSDVLKPLMQPMDDGRGGIVWTPSETASQSFMNWASMPAQIATAAGLAGRNFHEFIKWLEERRYSRPQTLESAPPNWTGDYP